MKIKPALLFSLCCAAAFSALSESSVRTLSQLPPAVQKSVQAQLAGGTLGEIERDEDESGTSYTVTVTRGGKERDFTVADDGTLLSQEVTLEETPPAVRNTIKAQVGQGTIENIEKTFEENEIDFEVDVIR